MARGMRIGFSDTPPAGIGFAARPYFFQADTYLAASVAANEPQAVGTTANNVGQPLAFTNVASLKLSTPSTQVPFWYMGVSGWLTSNATMRAAAKAECLALVRRSNSPIISGDEYQHIEDMMMETCFVVDCCYADFTSGERAEVSTWVGNVMTYAGGQVTSFWPGLDTPHNNYWQNHFLALCIAGICGDGWLASVATWRTKFETWAAVAVAQYTEPDYTGPQATEGHYYSAYTANMLWALRQYDAIMGTTYTAQVTVTAENQLNLSLYQLRPHHTHFFHIGSEAADSVAPFHGVQWRLWYQLIHTLGPSNPTARIAYGILFSSAVVNGANNIWTYTWGGTKAWDNFYWRIHGTTSLAVSNKTDRRLVLPTPGGAMTHLRNSNGFATNAIAAVIFHCRAAMSGARYADYSHTNFDSPGFQWASGAEWLVCDPEFFRGSGIDGELGSPLLSDLSNIVTLAGTKYVGTTAYPVTTHNEDNLAAAVPHYYLNIDAQPYWTNCTIYRRQYVFLDDMQVCVLWDRVATSGTVTKTWRLHTQGMPSIASSVATITPGALTIRVRDLYSTNATAMTARNLASDGTATGGSATTLVDSSKAWETNEWVGYTVKHTDGDSRGIVTANTATTLTVGSWDNGAPAAGFAYTLGFLGAGRIEQIGTSNDWRSLKVLDVGNRVSAASLSSGAGYLQADMTIAGVSRSVRFFDDGSHATVS